MADQMLRARLAGLVGSERRVAVEVRVRVREGALLEGEEALLVPAGDVARARVDVDGEVEQVAHGEPVPGNGRLQHVQSLDDQHIGSPHHDLGVGDDVVRQVGVERGAHLGGAPFTSETKRRSARRSYDSGNPFAAHQPTAFELAVGQEEAVGRHEFDARSVVPAGEQLPEQTGDGRFADGDGAGDADHEGSGSSALAEERARRAVQLARTSRIERDQARKGDVDLRNLGEVQPVAEPPQLHHLGLGERQVRAAGQLGPVGADDLDERRGMRLARVIARRRRHEHRS